jgi:signal transduction histidine kinase
MLHVINRNAERLRQLIEDILDVTKIESQALHLKNERFVLNELIQNVINEYTSQIKRDQRHVRISFFPRENFIIQGDKVRISQVVSNLLSNAIKFTEEHGSVVISTEHKKEEGERFFVVILIKDTGIGIDPSILPRLFTKFASKSERGGTGLGLYISKSSGRIWAENNPDGKGAVFSFSLPSGARALTDLPSL